MTKSLIGECDHCHHFSYFIPESIVSLIKNNNKAKMTCPQCRSNIDLNKTGEWQEREIS